MKQEEKKQTEETQQEQIGFKVLNKKPYYNEQVTIKEIATEITPYKAVLILNTVEFGEITTKLQKEVSKEIFNQELGMKVTEKETEKVNKEDLKEVLPDIILQMAKLLRTKKQLICNISFTETNALVNGEEQNYKQMYSNDLETIYCKDIHLDDTSNMDAQILKRDKRKKAL